jgi:Holliday junction resolvase
MKLLLIALTICASLAQLPSPGESILSLKPGSTITFIKNFYISPVSYPNEFAHYDQLVSSYTKSHHVCYVRIAHQSKKSRVIEENKEFNILNVESNSRSDKIIHLDHEIVKAIVCFNKKSRGHLSFADFQYMARPSFTINYTEEQAQAFFDRKEAEKRRIEEEKFANSDVID